MEYEGEEQDVWRVPTEREKRPDLAESWRVPTEREKRPDLAESWESP